MARNASDRWAVIGRGKVGWHATAADGNCSSSGGDLERGWNGFRECESGYAEEAIPGALVYDASAAEIGAFATLVIAGPMCRPDIPAGMVERALTWPRVVEPYTDANPPRSLDRIGAEDYRARLAKVPGVKLGKVVGRKVVWDS